MSLPHWEYFLAIESDLEKCSRYVEFCSDNYYTYSLEFARIIMSSGSELDTVLKVLCKALDASKRPSNILKYYPILHAKYPKFTSFEILIPRFKIKINPWQGWTTSKSPNWWSNSFNKIKHERDKNFNEANLINAINATAGLLCVILYYYKECFNGGEEIDNRHAPKLFVPSDSKGYSWGGPWYYYTPD